MSKKIENRKVYVIHHDSPYLRDKYGDNFEAWIEGTDKEVMGKSWEDMALNPAAMNYAVRTGREGLDVLDEKTKTYYVKAAPLGSIKGLYLGEFIHESEIGHKTEKAHL